MRGARTLVGPAVVFLLSLALLAPARASAAPLQPGEVVRHGKGELRVVGGVPFLKLAGTYREMGIDYGVLMKGRIRELLDATGMPDFVRHRSWLERWKLRRRLPRALLELIDGIAEGSGLPAAEVFWVNFGMPGGCSSFLVRTGEGLLLGHNQDRLQDGRFKVVVEFAPERGYRYVISSYAGTIDMLEGMNEKGLVLTQDAATGRPASVRLSLFQARNQAILETAASLADAEAVLARNPGDGNLLVVASAGGSGAAYDLAGGRVFKTDLGAGPLVATNTHLAAALGEHPEECPRYASIRARLEASPPAGARDLVATLRDDGTLRGTNNETTVHSLVFDPARRIVYVSFGASFAAWERWLRYDWLTGEVTEFAGPAAELSRHEVRLRSMPAHRAAVARVTLKSAADAGPAWDRFGGELDSAGVPLLHNVPCSTFLRADATGVELELRLPVGPRARASAAVSIATVPAAVFAVTLHPGSYETLPEAYRDLHRWMTRNGYVAAGPVTECYLRRAYNQREPSLWLTEVRIPVARAGERQRVNGE